MMAAESPANMLLLDTKESCMLRKVIAFTEVRTTLAFLLNAINNLDEHVECKSLVVFRERVEKFSEWINQFLAARDAPPMANGFDHEQHKQWSLGAIYLGSMGKVFRQENNKNAALLWEAPGRLLKVPFCLILVLPYLPVPSALTTLRTVLVELLLTFAVYNSTTPMP